nr:copia protein [Tanacetum cinerariifolium]
MENNLDYAKELARLQRQEYEAHSVAAKHGFEFSNDTTALLHQAIIETRRNLVLAAGVPASIVSTGGVPAGNVPASGVPAGSLSASIVSTGGVHTGSVPAGSLPASESVPAIFTNDPAATSPLTPGYSLGSSSTFAVDPVATKRVNTIHPQSQIVRALQSPVQTRSTVQKSKFDEKPSSVAKALEDLDWVASMQEEMQQFYHQQVWKLVPLPDGKIAIGTKWILKNKRDARGIVVYVDDIIFGSTNKAWCDEFEVLMKGEFEMSAMGELTFFLGLQVKQMLDRIFISQDKYVKDMLKKFDMESLRTTTTPYEVLKNKSKDDPDDAVNVHLFRSMIGSLMYLTASRPDIMFALEAYSDSDYAGSHGDRKSTTGGCQFLGRSCCGQVLWIQNQMLDYGFNLMNTKIFIDNQSTICIVKNPVFHQRIKHIGIRHHFIRDANEKNLIQSTLGCSIPKYWDWGRNKPKGRLTIVYTVYTNFCAGLYVYSYIFWSILSCRMNVVSCGVLLYADHIVSRSPMLLVLLVHADGPSSAPEPTPVREPSPVMEPIPMREPTPRPVREPTPDSPRPPSPPPRSEESNEAPPTQAPPAAGGAEDSAALTALSIKLDRVKRLEGLLHQIKQRLVLFDSKGEDATPTEQDIDLEALHTLASTSLGGDSIDKAAGHAAAEVPADATMPFRSTSTTRRRLMKPFTSSTSAQVLDNIPPGADIPATATTIPAGSSMDAAVYAAAAPSSPILAIDKGKAPMVDESLPADLLSEQECILKNLHDYQLGEDLAKKLHTEQEAKFARPQEELAQKAQAERVALPTKHGLGLSDQCRRELDTAQLIYTESDWVELLAKIATNSALSKQLLGDDVTEDNMNERLGMLLLRKRRELAEQRSTFRPKPTLDAPSAKRANQGVPQVLAAESCPADTSTASAHVSVEPSVAASTPSSSHKRRKHIAKKGVTPIVDIADAALIKFNSDIGSDDDPLPYAPYAGWKMVPSPLGFVHAYYDLAGQTKHFTSLRELLHMVERTDLQKLLGTVDNLYQREDPDTFDFLFWRIHSWRLYPRAQVHILETVDGWVIYMFVDVSYPLSAATLERMLKHGLEVPKLLVGGDLTMAEQLSWLVQEQTTLGKDKSNPLTVGSLLKTIWSSIHHLLTNEVLTSPEQTTLGKDVSNPFMAVMVCQKPLGYFSLPMIHVPRAKLVINPPGYVVPAGRVCSHLCCCVSAECQIVNNSKKGLGYENHNAVPPPYIGNFMHPTPDLSFTGLNEFDNKPVAENTKSSKEETKAVRKDDDALIIKEWVSDDEEENVSQPKLENKIVRLIIVKKELVKPRQHEKTARKTVRQVEHNRQNTHRARGNQRN